MSIEMPYYPPQSTPTLFERLTSTSERRREKFKDDEWLHLEQFLSQIRKLLELLAVPSMPFLVEEKIAGSKGSRENNKNSLLDMLAQCEEAWDEDMFRAQYKDWYDMVKRQQRLNAGGGGGHGDGGLRHEGPSSNSSLSELSASIREAEIELSIAMASKDQLERVHKRLEALRADKDARYRVLAHIVFDVGYRELNDGILVEPPEEGGSGDGNGGGFGVTRANTLEFPRLTSVVPGVFGDQLAMSGEALPVG